MLLLAPGADLGPAYVPGRTARTAWGGQLGGHLRVQTGQGFRCEHSHPGGFWQLRTAFREAKLEGGLVVFCFLDFFFNLERCIKLHAASFAVAHWHVRKMRKVLVSTCVSFHFSRPRQRGGMDPLWK